MLDKSNLPEFDPDVYRKIALNDLVVYSIHHFQRDGVEITTEDIISGCFLLFPKRFSMRNYPHWPDSAVVSRRWNECRVKGYIAGSAAEGFKVTARGIKFAERVAKKLGVSKPVQATQAHALNKVNKTRVKPLNKADAIQPKRAHPSIQTSRITKAHALRSHKSHTPVSVGKLRPTKTSPIKSVIMRPPVLAVKEGHKLTDKAHPVPVSVPKEIQARAGKFVYMMERSDAYIHYKKNGKNSRISEFDFRSMLLCTMESSRETLAKNLKLFKEYAGIHDRQDLLIFLNHCGKRFSYLLVSPQRKLKKPIRKSIR